MYFYTFLFISITCLAFGTVSQGGHFNVLLRVMWLVTLNETSWRHTCFNCGSVMPSCKQIAVLNLRLCLPTSRMYQFTSVLYLGARSVLYSRSAQQIRCLLSCAARSAKSESAACNDPCPSFPGPSFTQPRVAS